MIKISKDLVGASTAPLILGILQTGDHYGYEIIKKVKEASGGAIEWADGMLYPVLHKLEEKGQIESYWQDSPEGRKRKYYRLKNEGKKMLAEAQANWSFMDLLFKNLCAPKTI